MAQQTSSDDDLEVVVACVVDAVKSLCDGHITDVALAGNLWDAVTNLSVVVASIRRLYAESSWHRACTNELLQIFVKATSSRLSDVRAEHTLQLLWRLIPKEVAVTYLVWHMRKDSALRRQTDLTRTHLHLPVEFFDEVAHNSQEELRAPAEFAEHLTLLKPYGAYLVYIRPLTSSVAKEFIETIELLPGQQVDIYGRVLHRSPSAHERWLLSTIRDAQVDTVIDANRSLCMVTQANELVLETFPPLVLRSPHKNSRIIDTYVHVMNPHHVLSSPVGFHRWCQCVLRRGNMGVFVIANWEAACQNVLNVLRRNADSHRDVTDDTNDIPIRLCFTGTGGEHTTGLLADVDDPHSLAEFCAYAVAFPEGCVSVSVD